MFFNLHLGFIIYFAHNQFYSIKHDFLAFINQLKECRSRKTVKIHNYIIYFYQVSVWQILLQSSVLISVLKHPLSRTLSKLLQLNSSV